MRLLHSLNGWTSRMLLILSGVALVAMTLLTMANVVMRLVAGSIFGTVEVIGWLAVGVNALALGYSQIRREHVAITLFSDWMPGIWTRRLDALGYLIGLVFTVTAVWGLWKYIAKMMQSGQLSTSLSITYWPMVAVLLVGVIGLMLVLLEDFLTALIDIRKMSRNGTST